MSDQPSPASRQVDEAVWSDPEVATIIWTTAVLASVGTIAVGLLAAWWWAVLVPVGYAVMAVRAYLWMRDSDAKHSTYSAPEPPRCPIHNEVLSGADSCWSCFGTPARDTSGDPRGYGQHYIGDNGEPPMVCDRCGARSNVNQCPKGMHHQFVWAKQPATNGLGASGATSNESPGSVGGAS